MSRVDPADQEAFDRMTEEPVSVAWWVNTSVAEWQNRAMAAAGIDPNKWDPSDGFADPAVQRLLQRVLASPDVNDGRKQIVRDEILTGNAQKDVVEMREAGEIR